MNFDGKNILITGSTRGIGLATAKLLLSLGATVGINGRDPDKTKTLCDELDGNTIPLPCDLSNPEKGKEIIQTFTGKVSTLDGLINNAGSGKAIAFRGITLEKWQSTFKLNTEAVLTATHEAYNVMRKQKSGNIVNVTSISAHGPGKWMGADYAASKAAIVSLTKSLAFEAARFGIRVNAVSPGIIETDMTQSLSEEMKESLNVPLGRIGQPEEIAQTIAFLLSDQSAYITGQAIHADGGLWMRS